MVLVFATKDDIKNYATTHQLVHREDSSNQEAKYQRNFIRHHVVPALKTLNPTLEQTIYQSIQYIKQSVDIVLLNDNNTNESKVWAENETTVFTVVNKTVVEKVNSPNVRSGFSDCFQQYGISGISNCTSCINCINSCWSKNKKWKRISCALSNCVGSCASCVKSFVSFVNCVYN